ncbi:MAG: GNAT family N-acetyltransferase [Anaerolineales bacterium]|nr:GNAT family N-acetyltransferase [Anaerolineales bacterium]
MDAPRSEKVAAQKAHIRPACSQDMPAIYALMAAYDMFGEFSAEGCVVAEVNGRLCGFARIEEADNTPYLRPIVVSRQNQGQGIGKALLHHLLNQKGRLVVISRGSAVRFYAQAGFETTDWEQIHPPFRHECVVCPELETCTPIPLSAAAG